MPADTVEVVVKLTGLANVQAGMRRLREAVTGPLEMAAGRMRGFALSLGSTLLAGLSVYRVGAELKQALDEMDRADEVAQKLGIAADQLTALNYAATLADSSAEALQNGLKFLARAAESNADAFATLGVETRTADGGFRPQVELLTALADRFAAMPDGIQKTALAMQVFGREGVSMIPLLNAGADGIRGMMDEARAFGVVVAPDAAAGASLLNDNLNRLRMAVQGLAQTALAELLPALLDLTHRLLDWVKQNDAVTRGAHLLAEALRYVLFDVVALITAGKTLWQNWRGYVDGLTRTVTAFGVAASRAILLPQSVLRGWLEALKTSVRMVGELASAMLLVGQGKFGQAADKATLAGRMITAAFEGAAGNSVQAILETGEAIATAFDTYGKAADHTRADFTESWGRAFAELQQAYRDIWHPAPLPPAPATGAGTDLEADLDSADRRRRRLADELRDAQNELRRRRQEVAEQIARLDASYGVTDAEKHAQRIALLREEVGLLDQAIARLRERLAVERDEDARRTLSQALQGAESERFSAQAGLNRAQEAPDPYSFRDQTLATLTDLQNQIGTTAQMIARQFSSVIGSAIDGIAQGIEGLIKGTMDWGDALRNIGASILNGVISAISRMFAEWIVQRALMAVKNIAFSQAEGTADAAAKAPGALMSSISSFGVAAIVGSAALITALAAISGAFAEGGIVRGPGGPKDDRILARLSNGEAVLNAAAVQHYGAGVVNALNQRTARFYTPPGANVAPDTRAPGVAAAGPATPPGRSAAVNLVLVDSRNQARQFLESSEGEAMLVEILRKRRMQIGVPT